MSQIFTQIIQIIIQFIAEIYKITGDLGWAIVLFTILIRSILIPLTLPSLKAQKKMKELKPEIDKLKEKHGADKVKLQQAQMDLYKKYNVNPLAGCLPQLAQIAVLIILYQALIHLFNLREFGGVEFETTFYWLDLTVPDKYFVIPVVAAVSQLFLSLMIAPGAEIRDVVPNDSKSKKVKKENKKEENMADMASSMQQQMIFLMPLMTGFIATRFPAGLGLYWIATTVFSIIQQYFISGPGGIVSYSKRGWNLIRNLVA